MKHLKTLGLAAIAALGLMAFVGAGTASATTISTNANGTGKYPVGTEIHLSMVPGTSTLFETTGGAEIGTCTEETYKARIEHPVVETVGVKYPSGTTITGPITAWAFGGCSQTTDTLANGSLEIMKSGADEGEIVGKNTSITLGVFGVSCVYGTSAEGTKLGTITGGAAPKLVINAVLPKKEGGFLCPSSDRWTAEFFVTSPHELHIVD